MGDGGGAVRKAHAHRETAEQTTHCPTPGPGGRGGEESLLRAISLGIVVKEMAVRQTGEMVVIRGASRSMDLSTALGGGGPGQTEGADRGRWSQDLNPPEGRWLKGPPVAECGLFAREHSLHGASLVAQLVKNPHPFAVQETWVPSLGWEDPLEKGKAAHSSTLAWKIPWTV